MRYGACGRPRPPGSHGAATACGHATPPALFGPRRCTTWVRSKRELGSGAAQPSPRPTKLLCLPGARLPAGACPPGLRTQAGRGAWMMTGLATAQLVFCLVAVSGRRHIFQRSCAVSVSSGAASAVRSLTDALPHPLCSVRRRAPLCCWCLTGAWGGPGLTPPSSAPASSPQPAPSPAPPASCAAAGRAAGWAARRSQPPSEQPRTWHSSSP